MLTTVVNTCLIRNVARNLRLALALDRQEMALIRKAAKTTKMTLSKYIRETVVREAGDDSRKEVKNALP